MVILESLPADGRREAASFRQHSAEMRRVLVTQEANIVRRTMFFLQADVTLFDTQRLVYPDKQQINRYLFS
jgi:hypothetical protein